MLSKLLRTMLPATYEYPAWDYNVYAEPEMTMDIAEPTPSPWLHANVDAGVSPEEYASWFALPQESI
eukprot:CAMPEP_0196759796 /NCGR_PEP_ID=MMETSP1091-20130531/104884_1 /TAXON_ID=302021 /ORGANISM="Rhodomonas sp., Strain CCMP768" /LENGTH=66 /DNA_ID=CAMNT_0042108655 /DNA_START=36 /DNA_END=236 /DNA_ORIENTATION=+